MLRPDIFEEPERNGLGKKGKRFFFLRGGSGVIKSGAKKPSSGWPREIVLVPRPRPRSGIASLRARPSPGPPPAPTLEGSEEEGENEGRGR